MDYILRKAEEVLGEDGADGQGFQFPGGQTVATRGEGPPASRTRGAAKRAAARGSIDSPAVGAPIVGTLYADDAALAGGGAVPIETAALLTVAQRLRPGWQR